MAWRLLNNKKENYVKGVVSKFWIELLNPKVICNYETRSSIKTYLANIFKKRIIDNNLAFNISKKHNEKNLQCVLDNEDYNLSQDNDLIQKKRLQLLHEAILMLANNSPKDADLMRMHLKDLNYREMATKILNNQKENQDKVKKLTNAIKKQFTRKKTGTLAKFKICFDRCLEIHNMTSVDL